MNKDIGEIVVILNTEHFLWNKDYLCKIIQEQ